MRLRAREIDPLWANDQSLSALLGTLLILIFVLHPLVSMGYDLALVVSAAFSLAMAAGVMAVAHTHAARLALGTMALVAIAVHWTRYTSLGATWQNADGVASFFAFAMLATIVFVRVFGPGPITHYRIQGAIAGYLLIALMFATAYVWLDLHVQGGFTGSDTVLPAQRDQRIAGLAYFSLITLTTVGYGDIVAVHPIARSLATLEALIGQIFPAVLLARLVSLEMVERQRRRGEPDH